jgi:hypothetical protein
MPQQIVERTAEVERPVEREVIREPLVTNATAEPRSNLAERVIWYVAGVLLVLLALRFVLALLGANPTNGFANFIYSVSHPFVAPFFSLFGYRLQYGVSRFELYTLIAMAVYALIAWGLARLVTINEPRTATPR